jgi:hypothetical protein
MWGIAHFSRGWSVVTDGSSVARLNTHQGQLDTIELDEREWHYHPDGDDLAVCPLPMNQQIHKVDPIILDWFLTHIQPNQRSAQVADRAITEPFVEIAPNRPDTEIGRSLSSESRRLEVRQHSRGFLRLR